MKIKKFGYLQWIIKCIFLFCICCKNTAVQDSLEELPTFFVTHDLIVPISGLTPIQDKPHHYNIKNLTLFFKIQDEQDVCLHISKEDYFFTIGCAPTQATPMLAAQLPQAGTYLIKNVFNNFTLTLIAE